MLFDVVLNVNVDVVTKEFINWGMKEEVSNGALQL